GRAIDLGNSPIGQGQLFRRRQAAPTRERPAATRVRAVLGGLYPGCGGRRRASNRRGSNPWRRAEARRGGGGGGRDLSPNSGGPVKGGARPSAFGLAVRP